MKKENIIVIKKIVKASDAKKGDIADLDFYAIAPRKSLRNGEPGILVIDSGARGVECALKNKYEVLGIKGGVFDVEYAFDGLKDVAKDRMVAVSGKLRIRILPEQPKFRDALELLLRGRDELTDEDVSREFVKDGRLRQFFTHVINCTDLKNLQAHGGKGADFSEFTDWMGGWCACEDVVLSVKDGTTDLSHDYMLAVGMAMDIVKQDARDKAEARQILAKFVNPKKWIKLIVAFAVVGIPMANFLLANFMACKVQIKTNYAVNEGYYRMVFYPGLMDSIPADAKKTIVEETDDDGNAQLRVIVKPQERVKIVAFLNDLQAKDAYHRDFKSFSGGSVDKNPLKIIENLYNWFCGDFAYWSSTTFKVTFAERHLESCSIMLKGADGNQVRQCVYDVVKTYDLIESEEGVVRFKLTKNDETEKMKQSIREKLNSIPGHKVGGEWPEISVYAQLEETYVVTPEVKAKLNKSPYLSNMLKDGEVKLAAHQSEKFENELYRLGLATGEATAEGKLPIVMSPIPQLKARLDELSKHIASMGKQKINLSSEIDDCVTADSIIVDRIIRAVEAEMKEGKDATAGAVALPEIPAAKQGIAALLQEVAGYQKEFQDVQSGLSKLLEDAASKAFVSEAQPVVERANSLALDKDAALKMLDEDMKFFNNPINK